MSNKGKVIVIVAIGLLLPVLLMAVMATPADAAEVVPAVWTQDSIISLNMADMYGADAVQAYQFGDTNAAGEKVVKMTDTIDRTAAAHTYIWADIDYAVSVKGYVYVSDMVEVAQSGEKIGHYTVGLQRNAAGLVYPRIGSYLKDSAGNWVEDFAYYDAIADNVAQMAVQIDVRNMRGYEGAQQWLIDMRLYQYTTDADGNLILSRVDKRVMVLDADVIPVDVATKTVRAATAGVYMADVNTSVPALVAARNYGERQRLAGYDSAYGKGYAAGYDEGADNGYQSGLIEGNKRGWQQGYDECAEEVKTSKSAIWDIMSMPFNLLAGVLNFEVFGVNVFAAVTSIITVALVVFVLKKVGVF